MKLKSLTGLQSLVKGLIKGSEGVYKVLLYTQIQNKEPHRG